MATVKGLVRKMRTENAQEVQYTLPIGDELLLMNALIGKQVRLEFLGDKHCVECGREIKKSFQQGYCFPCMRSLPQTDNCMVRPELCHFHEGTCRDAQWGQANCMGDHFLYLANSSGLKVGITRKKNIPTRWMDQGATQALPIIRAATRYDVGQLEIVLKAYVNDRTDWRRMLKGMADPLDMVHEKHRILALSEESLAQIDEKVNWSVLRDESIQTFDYPVQVYPEKVSSFNLDKNPLVEGKLVGIKGQYLIFDHGVINIRKYGGYSLGVSH